MARIDENWHTRLYSMCWHSTVDVHFNTADDALTSAIFMNFGLVTTEFRRRVCTGRATRWALSHIFSFKRVGVSRVFFSRSGSCSGKYRIRHKKTQWYAIVCDRLAIRYQNKLMDVKCKDFLGSRKTTANMEKYS